MLHVTCDGCGKALQPGRNHHVVKIEVFTAHDPAELTEADLDSDNLEAVADALQRMEENDDPDCLEPPSRHFRYDLCPGCRERFVRDPLSKEAAQKFDFSEN
jgi:hypothetical protein